MLLPPSLRISGLLSGLLSVSITLGLLSAPLVGQRNKPGVGWPFAAAGAGPTAAKRDLFNLGILGLKAWDAEKPEPKAAGSGRRRFARSGKPEGDDGPKRLLVRALFGGGPAMKAGLRVDDVLVGVDQATFESGSLAPLAEALLRAEAETGFLVLKVEREGATKDVKVKVRKAGKAARLPVEGKQRDKILAAALGWLAKAQSGDGGFPATLGGSNGQVVHACMAGLAWLAGGSSLRSGKHRKNIAGAAQFVERKLYAKDPFAGAGGGANWNQSSWAFAYSVLFLSELQLASKNRKGLPFLKKITKELCIRQEVSGGYGHGPGGKNALGYVELNILGSYVLSALGVAKQAGIPVDEAVVKKLAAYMEASASKDGGVGYSTAPGQAGQGNIGRTAGAWLGAVGLGLRQQPFVQKMQSYVRDHIGEVLKGHASLMQHIMLAGVGAAALGEEAQAEYWKQLRRDLILARAPDGSLQPRPWHESLLMSSNTDVSMGQVWTTASWAVVLGAQRGGKKGGLVGWCGRKIK